MLLGIGPCGAHCCCLEGLMAGSVKWSACAQGAGEMCGPALAETAGGREGVVAGAAAASVRRTVAWPCTCGRECCRRRLRIRLPLQGNAKALLLRAGCLQVLRAQALLPDRSQASLAAHQFLI